MTAILKNLSLEEEVDYLIRLHGVSVVTELRKTCLKHKGKGEQLWKS